MTVSIRTIAAYGGLIGMGLSPFIALAVYPICPDCCCNWDAEPRKVLFYSTLIFSAALAIIGAWGNEQL